MKDWGVASVSFDGDDAGDNRASTLAVLDAVGYRGVVAGKFDVANDEFNIAGLVHALKFLWVGLSDDRFEGDVGVRAGGDACLRVVRGGGAGFDVRHGLAPLIQQRGRDGGKCGVDLAHQLRYRRMELGPPIPLAQHFRKLRSQGRASVMVCIDST